MESPNKILVIQLKRAGDVIVTTPVLPALRRILPKVDIDFLVDAPFASLLDHHPDIRRTHLYDRQAPWKSWHRLREESYDCILDFQSSPRSVIAGLLSGAKRRAGYRVSFWGQFFTESIKRPGSSVSVTEGKMTLIRSLWPEVGPAGERRIYLTLEERQWAESVMPTTTGAKMVGLVPTHRRTSRRWGADSFVQLAQLLAKKGAMTWLFWGPGEKEYVETIAKKAPDSRMIPATSLRQMAALLERCQTVVTNDNGPMHLAVAVGTPTVTLYGPTNPLAWNPGVLPHRVIQAKGVGCLGCNLNQCPFGHECMTGISPDQVLEAVL
jgi:lipopolysaccharide heptosyltransferase II